MTMTAAWNCLYSTECDQLPLHIKQLALAIPSWLNNCWCTQLLVLKHHTHLLWWCMLYMKFLSSKPHSFSLESPDVVLTPRAFVPLLVAVTCCIQAQSISKPGKWRSTCHCCLVGARKRVPLSPVQCIHAHNSLKSPEMGFSIGVSNQIITSYSPEKR